MENKHELLTADTQFQWISWFSGGGGVNQNYTQMEFVQTKETKM